MSSDNLADALRPADVIDGRLWGPSANVPYGATGELRLVPGIRPIEPPPLAVGCRELVWE